MLNTAFSPWPSFTDEEIDAVARVLRSGRVNYWTGEECRAFEREFAAWCGTAHAIALTNGTVALDIALRALGIGRGDEVIVTPRTFIASVSAIIGAGATPIFADVDRESGNITAATIEAVLSPRTRAILCVHLAGWPCDMPSIMALAERHRLEVIEDCAQAHGARCGDRNVGSFGHIGAWSFCQDKILTTGGEGGMVTTNDRALWSAMWSYKDHGKAWDAVYERQHPPGFRWLHESFGTNWRMLEAQAAIGRLQLQRLDAWTAARTRNARRIAEACREFTALRTPLPCDEFTHAFYRLYAYVRPERLEPGWNRDRIQAEISQRGVPCYQGSCSEVYLEKAFDNTGLRPSARLPVARELGETSLMFLVHPTLTDAEVDRTRDAIACVMKEASVEETASVGGQSAVDRSISVLRRPNRWRRRRNTALTVTGQPRALTPHFSSLKPQPNRAVTESEFAGRTLVITGGTGTFGNAVLRRFLDAGLREIRIFSRDEKKQDDMRRAYGQSNLRFYLGDVRVPESLRDVMTGADFVFHAAALKQVPSCEFHPMEAVRTNVLGAENVLSAAVDAGVKRVVVLSTDKAAYPINAMGMSKALMEKIAIAKARTAAHRGTVICATRYGNVMASRGSVIPLFVDQIRQGKPLTVTDPTMTRFMMTIEDAVELVVYAFTNGQPGDLFVQKAPSATIEVLAQAMKLVFGAENPVRLLGTRHGEKLYETLLTREEMARAEDLGRYFRVPPDGRDLNYESYFTEGELKLSQASDFHSHNAPRLEIHELVERLRSLDVVREALPLLETTAPRHIAAPAQSAS